MGRYLPYLVAATLLILLVLPQGLRAEEGSDEKGSGSHEEKGSNERGSQSEESSSSGSGEKKDKDSSGSST